MFLTALCLMSLTGLLTSTEKMVQVGRLHMRPFQFHLKEHLRLPYSLDVVLPWSETISAPLECCQNPANVMKDTDKLTVVACINKQGGTHSAEMCTLLWKIMTWCHHYQMNLKSQAHSRVPQCDGLPSIQSNKQNGHCIRRCSNRSIKWFTPHVDLFATHL